ncbi:MAG: DUF1330 domain-containing protein [Alphaproteobacteria bacterium]|jgi:uncharacterized protein (DUF1330 family)|nr:DUF1330 domain-containing protein [Rhodospirillaceae bacterium]MBT6511206.1 DUF1330 domain-containing protein [Rhodospirillaceae bacterium]MBT7648723.1 DUF1330 domain-containing protein [Rhodospirillaceae bacterium]MDG2479813.1 DUF1330 domain-containing protein [Alphaproteobacteria bacterium]
MAFGYYVVELDVKHPEMMPRYRELVGPALAKFEGEVLAASENITHLEGEPAPLSRAVIIRFPSTEQALAWFRSDEYAEALSIREKACVSRSYVVEGLG